MEILENEVEQKIHELEDRIVKLEQSSHLDHNLSAEVVETIVKTAITKMNAHIKKLFSIGHSLLEE